MASDEDYMRLAIEEAKKGSFNTWTNPNVGACVVKDGQVLATGYHHHYGASHAERDTISKLTPEQLFDSTIYVTLEPCNHFGKQPPCSQLIIDSHIKRVVIAEVDPHKLVTGKGIQTLKDAGIEVKVGVLADEAANLNEHYNYFYSTELPYVTLKQAVTLDHKVCIKGKRSQITNSEVYKQVHEERANYQAIMIGSNTAIIDNPTLLTDANTDYPPVRVVVDRRGRLLDHLDLNLLQESSTQTWILTMNEELLKHSFPSNVKVFALQGKKAHDTIQLLADQGIQSVYVEGGPTLHKSLLDAGLVCDTITYVAPKFLGTKGVSGVVAQSELTLTDAEIKTFSDNVRIYGRIKNVQRISKR